MIRPIKALGGLISPAADCNPAAQCAIACAASIFPHCLRLSGRSFATRAFTSSAVDFSKRFFTRRCLRVPDFIIRLRDRKRSTEDAGGENSASFSTKAPGRSQKLTYLRSAELCGIFVQSFQNHRHEVWGKSAPKTSRLEAICGAFGASEVVRVHPRNRRAYAPARALGMEIEKVKSAAALHFRKVARKMD